MAAPELRRVEPALLLRSIHDTLLWKESKPRRFRWLLLASPVAAAVAALVCALAMVSISQFGHGSRGGLRDGFSAVGRAARDAPQVASHDIAQTTGYLALLKTDSNVELWEVGAKQPSLRFRAVPPGVQGFAQDIAITADAGIIGIGGLTLNDRLAPRGRVQLWQVSHESECVLRLDDILDLQSSVTLVEASPDGTRMAAGTLRLDGRLAEVRLYDVKTASLEAALPGDGQHIVDVSFSPDGTQMGACSASGVRIWDVATRQSVAWLPASVRMNAVAFAADGKRLFAAAADGTVLMWRTDTWDAAGLLSTGLPWVSDIAVLPDGGIAVVGINPAALRNASIFAGVMMRPVTERRSQAHIQLWKVGSSSELRADISVHGRGWLHRIAYSPVENALITSGFASGSVDMWNVERVQSEFRGPRARGRR